MQAPDQDSLAVAQKFRRFCLLSGSRELLRDGQPVDIGDRAFDLLAVLLNARGVVLTKLEIMKLVWPSTTVDESNLRFQMSMLRRVLGTDRDIIKTVTGRGYLFVAEIDTVPASTLAPIGQTITPSGPRPILALCRTEPALSQFVPEGPHSRVILIEGHEGLREGLRGLFQAIGISAECFSSVEEFFVRFNSTSVA